MKNFRTTINVTNVSNMTNVTLSVLLLAIAEAMSGTACAAETERDGPWFAAKTGTLISYRIRQEAVIPGTPPKVAIITEEVTNVSPETVTVKITRKAAGVPDRITNSDRPRRISERQYVQMLKNIGTRQKEIDFKVSGMSFACQEYKLESEDPGGDADRPVSAWTTFCKDLPGWIATQSVGSFKRFEMLEVKK